MDTVSVLSAGVISMLVVDGIKWVIRKIKKDPTYSFPTVFYSVGIPVLNVFTPFALFWLGVSVSSPVLTLSWLELLKYAITVALGSVVSFLGYNTTLKTLKDYSKTLEK
jgi:hypothetical protein